MFCTYLVEKGYQSSTIKSYVSGIKKCLTGDGYPWDDTKLILNSLTKACKLKNDTVYCRRPITKNLLEMLIFELDRFIDSHYLRTMYRAMLCIGYYGLMRVGELADGPHVAKVCNVFVGQNKEKILIILYSSKTHGKESRPQEIKISSLTEASKNTNSNLVKLNSNSIICPFKAMQDYKDLRGGYSSKDENFFVFSDGTAIKPQHLRTVLRTCLKRLNLNPNAFDCHSLRVGRTSDLIKMGVPIELVKIMGRWKSNAVYRYIRNF